ncbi:MAG TPA: acetyl-CoA C-acyltransferase [Actinomycetota bacterium]|nr:acetyl-CoA C-acyltransferase [Actinomycetota bacterium]
MPDAVIVDGTRSPIGRAYKGALKDVRPDDLGGYIVQKLMEKFPDLDPTTIDDVMVGCGLPHGESGFNVARPIVLLSGLPNSVPATTVNRFCSSSLQTIRMAFHAIKAGEGSTFISAGVESSSRVELLPRGDVTVLNPRLSPLFGGEYIADIYISMGETAENVADRFDVSREDMDRFAQQSQERAVSAQKDGFFTKEITPIPLATSGERTIIQEGGDSLLVEHDDGPRPSSTYEKLASLEGAFRPGGKVTAGNSCPLNDGAAAVLVMEEAKARSLGLKPRVRIIASAVSALEPEIMGVGPIEAVRKALAIAGMTIEDIDVVELNEAFAAQVLPVCRELGIDPFSDKLNPHGGAIALGHPFGMTGSRIMNTLMNDLETLDRTIGLETMCVGGGQGMAMIVERIN